jgi:hypothetical protein
VRRSPPLDLSMYVKGVALLARHPSVFITPLLAAVVALLIAQVTPFFTDALGGLGAGIFQMLAQLVYLWAFAIAVIAAENIWRGRRASFDDAWEEGRQKFSGIALAAVGFQFVIFAASYVGSFFSPVLALGLGAVAAFFLIYTIPAAAIGGMPGSLAISASVQTVRANLIGSILLAFVFFALWNVAIPLFLPYLLVNLSPALWNLVMAAARALCLGYLAFPFAKQYDDIAFTRYW